MNLLPSPAGANVCLRIDTASKTGREHDATAVSYFAVARHGAGFPLMVLDWDIVQVEGALLETWLPIVFTCLEELAKQRGARAGTLEAMIEDKTPGRSCCNKRSAGECRQRLSILNCPRWGKMNERYPCPDNRLAVACSQRGGNGKRFTETPSRRTYAPEPRPPCLTCTQ